MEDFSKSSFDEAKEIKKILEQIESGQAESWPKFELIKREREELPVDSEAELSTRVAYYNSSIPIGRFVWNNANIIDHYYGTELTQNVYHNNRVFSFEGNEFNVMPSSFTTQTVPLYRHYADAIKDHMLSTSSSINSYTSEGLVGRIFEQQQVGTIPLKEYYSSLRLNHLYAVRRTETDDYLPNNLSDFEYVRTIGYVYPGTRPDSMRKKTIFYFANQSVHFPVTMEIMVNFTLKKISDGTISYPSYYYFFNVGGQTNLLIDTDIYIILDAYMTVNVQGYNSFNARMNEPFHASTDLSYNIGGKIIYLHKDLDAETANSRPAAIFIFHFGGTSLSDKEE
jgi:hypothetical protein